MIKFSVYDEVSGKCKICNAETLWGDAPHKDDCQVLELLNSKNDLDVYRDSYRKGTNLLLENLPGFTPTSLISIWLEAAKRLKELKK